MLGDWGLEVEGLGEEVADRCRAIWAVLWDEIVAVVEEEEGRIG
jgi:hypothetical protein